MRRAQTDMFTDERMNFKSAMELTAESLRSYGAGYRHWSLAFSGGKDSSATLTVVVHLIDSGRVPRPDSLTVIYADTRLELPPLHNAAMATLAELRRRGIRTQIVLPPLDKRFFVYMFGRGVPPSHSGFRWCTGALKIDPMTEALRAMRDEAGEKFLMLTGVRLDESAARDQRIAVSCSRDGTECGQGYFQRDTPDSVADRLAPIVHWRACFVWDWLRFEAPSLGFATADIAEVYGIDAEGSQAELGARTGCVGCPVAKQDTALDNVLKQPKWAYLAPLKRLRSVYDELSRPCNRLRRSSNTFGPLVMEARSYGIHEILSIQAEVNAGAAREGTPPVILIDDEELARIEELIAANSWPDKWTGEEMRGDALLEVPDGDRIALAEIMHGGGNQFVIPLQAI